VETANVRRIKENKEGLELNRTHHLLVYAEDLIYLLDENIIIKQKHGNMLLKKLV
jgi:hypothetical protein